MRIGGGRDMLTCSSVAVSDGLLASLHVMLVVRVDDGQAAESDMAFVICCGM